MDDENKKPEDGAPAGGAPAPSPAPDRNGGGNKPKSEQIKFNIDRMRNDLKEALIAEGKTPDEAERLAVLEHPRPPENEIPQWYKNLQRDETVKTVSSLVESITDEAERTAVKAALSQVNKELPPADQLKAARAIANAVRNAKIAEEAARGGKPPAHGSAPGAPAKPADPESLDDLTSHEKSMMGPPFNLTVKDIIAARNKEQATRA